MTKKKSKTVLLGSTGSGGTTEIRDRRFEKGEWPIRFVIEDQAQADTWLRYLWAECTKQGWGVGGLGQLDRKENSGSITITPTGGQAQVVAIWERKREGPLVVKARVADPVQLAMAQGFFERVNDRCRQNAKERFYVRGVLYYDGLPWRGELWLSDSLRLGPPSKQYEQALLGPRVVIVDTEVDAIDQMDAGAVLAVWLRELSVFLSVLTGGEVRVAPSDHYGWTWTSGSAGQIECDVRQFGYIEANIRQRMPSKGELPTALLVPVERPDFSLTFALWPGDTEEKLPADIVSLWRMFSGLPPNRREQFLNVGSMWQVAVSVRQEYQTAAFTFMVAACEALKPREAQFRWHNIYDVVEALLGKRNADLLREEWFRPQEVRSAHLHRGELRGSEFVQHVMMHSFHDPTFDEARRVLSQITPATLIEWLRRGGTFTMPAKRRRS